MPRLLPPEWIKQIAINGLLQLYEKESRFVVEWDQLKQPYASLVTQLTKVQILLDVNRVLSRKPPHDDFVAWVTDLQRLRNYLQNIPPHAEYSPDEFEKRNVQICEELNPYILGLTKLAYKWNLRAPWAAEALLQRDVSRLEQQIYTTSGVTLIDKPTDEQIQALLGDNFSSLPSERWAVNVVSLYRAKGRPGLMAKLGTGLARFEQKAKDAGAKEIPSALDKHTKWWFQHYVLHLTYPQISELIAQATSRVGPYPENVQKAVIKLSQLLEIELAEPP